MAAQIAGMTNVLSNIRPANPQYVTLPSPPKLEGALAPNDALSKAVRFAENIVDGPTSMVVVKGFVYTGLRDGWVVEVSPEGKERKIRRMSIGSCSQARAPVGACGKPLGIREYKGYLVVTDAHNGIVIINPVNRRYQQLVDPRAGPVKGKPLLYLNDLAVSDNGIIYFTSSSSKFTPSRALDIVLEGETTGRVLRYVPWLRQVQEVLSNVSFPSGLELSKDGKYLYVGEGGRSRIHKVLVDEKSPQYGKIELFADNLPGVVEKIRHSPRGGFWVGLSLARHEALPSILDTYGDSPYVRAGIMQMPRDEVLKQLPKYGIAVELDANGKVIRSLHDPQGTLFSSITEIEEDDKYLYIGSSDKKYIGRLRVADLPPLMPGDGGQTDSVSKQLEVFINQIRQKLEEMTTPKIRDIFLTLVRYLVAARVEAIQAQQKVKTLQGDLQKLQEMLGNGTTPGDTTTPSTTGDATTAAASDTTEQMTTPADVLTTSTGGGGDVTTEAGSADTTTTASPTGSDTTMTASGGADSTTSDAGASTTDAAVTTTSGTTDSTTDGTATDSSTTDQTTTDTDTTSSAGDTTTTATPP